VNRPFVHERQIGIDRLGPKLTCGVIAIFDLTLGDNVFDCCSQMGWVKLKISVRVKLLTAVVKY
jgi:hypothetical protein